MTSKKDSKHTNNAIKVAGIQMASSPNVSSNLIEAERLIKIAADEGAQIVVLPEYFCIMGVHDSDKVKVREEVWHIGWRQWAAYHGYLAHYSPKHNSEPIGCKFLNRTLSS